MRAVLFFITYTLIFTPTIYAQNYKWVKGGGSTTTMTYSRDDEGVRYMCTDDDKNVYILSPVGDDNITADSFYMASAFNPEGGTYPHFLAASYTCNGVLRWAKLFDGYYNSDPYGITYNQGSIYIIGNMVGTNKHVGYDTVINKQYVNSFIARFDTSGKYKWIKFTGPDSLNTLTSTGGFTGHNSIAVDGNGNVHYYQCMYNGVQIASTVRSTTGVYDMKYDSSGNLLSAVRMQIDSTELLETVAMNKKSNTVYAVLIPNPRYSSSIDYLAAYDPGGTQLWADTVFNGSVFDLVYDNIGGNVYGVGGGTPLIVGKDTVTNIFYTDFIKIDTNGHSKLLCGFYGNGASLYRIAFLPNGQLASTSHVIYYIAHGRDTVTSEAGGQHPIMCVVDTGGRFIKLDQLPSGGFYDWGLAITSDKDGDVYIGGQVQDTITAPGLSSSYISIGGNTDFFVVKYGYNCNCSITNEPTPNYSYSGSGTVYFTYTGTVTPDSVKWNFGDGVTSTSINPSHSFHDTGLHHVCLTVYACDSGTYCGYVHTSVDVPIFFAQPNISVYPNPISGAFFIEGAEMGATVRLFNLMGQQVYEGAIKENKQQINTGDLRLGTYLLQLINREGQKSNVTIVKQ